jgi:pyridoxamine 5'-phosphate oxidase
MSIASIRREYRLAALTEQEVDADPIRQFDRWFHDAQQAQCLEPNAMALATSSVDGVPDARQVLLKGVDANGFVFFTDYRSQKGQTLDANPRAALCFFWPELERQVRINGDVHRISRQESHDYFQSRPRGSRIGAWVSQQSSVLPSRDVLEASVHAATERFAEGDVPLPEHWGGYRVVPVHIEFWQGRESRLHDRIRYRRTNTTGTNWTRERLSP